MQPPNNQPNLICKSCGADRSKEDCKGDRLRCGLAGIAYSDHVAVTSAEPESRVPCTLRMGAYYYSFDATGVPAIDRILSAVACAGKSFHHTDSWNEDVEVDNVPEGHEGKTPVDWIQNAANDAAKSGISSTPYRPNEQNDFRCMEIGCGSITEGVHHHTCPEAAAGSQEGKQ